MNLNIVYEFEGFDFPHTFSEVIIAVTFPVLLHPTGQWALASSHRHRKLFLLYDSDSNTKLNNFYSEPYHRDDRPPDTACLLLCYFQLFSKCSAVLLEYFAHRYRVCFEAWSYLYLSCKYRNYCKDSRVICSSLALGVLKRSEFVVLWCMSVPLPVIIFSSRRRFFSETN